MSAVTNGEIQPERDGRGKLLRGNRGGPGNPQVRRIAGLRAAVVSSIAPDDMLEVMAVLLAKAKRGDMVAIKELFDRTLGKPQEPDIAAHIDELEAAVQRLTAEMLPQPP